MASFLNGMITVVNLILGFLWCVWWIALILKILNVAPINKYSYDLLFLYCFEIIIAVIICQLLQYFLSKN